MPVPEIEAWRKRWSAPQTRALGVTPAMIADGVAEFTIGAPYGDERDDDPLFFPAALTYAADIAAVAAVGAHVNPAIEQANGTASLFLNFVAAPSGAVRVRAEVGHWAAYQALVAITAHDAAGGLGTGAQRLLAAAEGARVRATGGRRHNHRSRGCAPS